MSISVGCRKREPEVKVDAGPPPEVAAELLNNGLGRVPGAVSRQAARSAIHWQPWTGETLQRAGDAQRLVFAVIVQPGQPGYQEVLKAVESDPAIVRTLNSEYVPVLIDGDASREIGLLTADLCNEIRVPLQLPLFVWMTHEGNPVAWIPLPETRVDSLSEVFDQSHQMVWQMWKHERKYVLQNSAADNASRRERFLQRKLGRAVSEQPEVDVVRCLRQLASMYDPFSKSFDEAGGIFPTGAMDLLIDGAGNPGLPSEVRERCLATASGLVSDLLSSPMVDALDGGAFASRRGQSWMLPTFHRDCVVQAKAAAAFFNFHRLTGDERSLDTAKGLISFAESSYRTDDGLFSIGLNYRGNQEGWMWGVDEVKAVLGDEDAGWWIRATGMKELGNLPSEADPMRIFFRENSLGWKQSVAEIAAEEGQSVEEFQLRFDRARYKMLAAREMRLPKGEKDNISHAGASFRMVSAYVAAYSATGDEVYREKALKLLEGCRTVFRDGPRLKLFKGDAAPSLAAGRAFLYGLALQAALDVAAITLDDQWLVWSEDLATTAAELFTGDGFLKECPDDARLIDVDVTDITMLFDDSTAGLIASAESRMTPAGRSLVKSFSELATPLTVFALDRPIVFTDILTAVLAREFPRVLVYGDGLSPEMREVVALADVRTVQRRHANEGDGVAAGSVKLVSADGEERVISTPAELREALLPSRGK